MYVQIKFPGLYAPPQGDLVSIGLYIHVYSKLNSLENLLLMNHWPECFLNWHGTILGIGDLSP